MSKLTFGNITVYYVGGHYTLFQGSDMVTIEDEEFSDFVEKVMELQDSEPNYN